jgi:hypothetical protein
VHFASAAKQSVTRLRQLQKKMAGKTRPSSYNPIYRRHHSASDFACRFAGAFSSIIALTNIIGNQNNIGMSHSLPTVRARIALKHRSSSI